VRSCGSSLQLPERGEPSLAAKQAASSHILRKATDPVGDSIDTSRLVDPVEQILRRSRLMRWRRAVEPRFDGARLRAGTAAKGSRPLRKGRRRFLSTP
jgi:hypothetical protein